MCQSVSKCAALSLRLSKTVARLLPSGIIRPMQLTVTKDTYKGHARSPWLVVVPRRLSPTGRRQYRRFSTKSRAQSFATALTAQVRAHGEQPLAAVAAAVAADATAALKLLEGTGLSLTDAVRQLLTAPAPTSVAFEPYHTAGGTGAADQRPAEGTQPAAAPLTVNSTFAIISGAKTHQATSTQRSRNALYSALFKRCPWLASAELHTCTPALIQRALDDTWGHSPQSWNSGRRQLHSLFAYAIRRRMVNMQNPVTPLELKRINESEITALLPERLAALFAACRPATPAEKAAAAQLASVPRRAEEADLTYLRPYIAICAFAGIRPTECSRLTWADIDLEDGIISVRGRQAKTGGTRHIELHPALRSWLTACRPANASPTTLITPTPNLTPRLAALRRRAGFGSGDPWQNDCLRHSYATYYLKAKQGTLAQLQLNMGHRDLQLLYSRYTNMRGTTRAMAESWWQILPE